jgi:hypothetical protein
MNRRSFLKSAGALGVLVAGGVVWRAWDQGVFGVGQGPAFEPWRDWQGEGPLALVRAAILASNPHNTQPWLFRISESRIDAYADVSRNLGAFDPYLREMHIGLGCALENMVIRAAALGCRTEIRYAEGALGPLRKTTEPVPVATLALSPGDAQRSDLHDAIPLRHTNRAAYDSAKPIADETPDAARHLAEQEAGVKVFFFPTPKEVETFGEAVIRTTEKIISDTEMVRDSERWFRYRWSEVQTLRDGPTLDAVGMSPWMTALAKILPAPSAETSHRYWLDATRNIQVPSTPVFGLIAVRDRYDRAQSLRAGRAWQRIHLFGVSRGLALQPVNQPMELVDRQRQLFRDRAAGRALVQMTGDAGWQPTFAFRMGHPTREVPPSPRRPVERVILS